MTDRPLCPEHGMPDCSPVLNGCSRLTSPTSEHMAEYAALSERLSKLIARSSHNMVRALQVNAYEPDEIRQIVEHYEALSALTTVALTRGEERLAALRSDHDDDATATDGPT